MTARLGKLFRQAVSIVCSLALVPVGALLMAQPPVPPAQNAPPPAQSLSPEQLDALLAPIALYPDSLLSQVLVASTYPLEVVEAAQWLAQNRNLQGQQLVDAARQQNWDASIQALVVFPDVLNRLNSDIQWTTDLGNAFLAEQVDVMNAVQRLRARAQAAGRLGSNPQQTVTTETENGQTAIAIQPANPQVVYVPYYNPEYIWGPPIWGYYPPLYYPAIGFGFGFGPGIYIGAFFGGLGWGGWGWGPNWFSFTVFQRPYFFNHYGFGRFYGGGYYGGGFRGGNWVHDPGHRLGVPYPNSSVASRFASSGFGGGRGSRSSFGSVGSQPGVSPGPRAFAPSGANRPLTNNTPASGWRRFGQPGAPTPVAGQFRGSNAQPNSQPNYGARSSSGGNNYRATPSPSYNYGGNRSTPSYRSSPFSGGSAPYRASPAPSYPRGNGSVPSYRSSPSFAGGGVRSGFGGGGPRSFGGGGGPRSFGGGGGGGYRSGGGGGHGGGGGGGSHGGGGGSHGGGRR